MILDWRGGPTGQPSIVDISGAMSLLYTDDKVIMA